MNLNEMKKDFIKKHRIGAKNSLEQALEFSKLAWSWDGFKEGLVEETRNVLAMGYDKYCVGLQVMGYKEVIRFLDGEINLEKCIELVKYSHKQYARRQRTWFEGEKRGYRFNYFKPISS
jgi:tRNA A37 N6-isopentenylltransferase MiaA